MSEDAAVCCSSETPQQKECSFCGESILVNAKKCKHCGEIVDPLMREIENLKRQQNANGPIIINNNNNNNNGLGIAYAAKSRLIYILLAIFFGLLGIHNFYAKYTITGIIQLILTCSGVGAAITALWIIFDILFTTKDGNGIPFA